MTIQVTYDDGSYSHIITVPEENNMTLIMLAIEKGHPESLGKMRRKMSNEQELSALCDRIKEDVEFIVKNRIFEEDRVDG